MIFRSIIFLISIIALTIISIEEAAYAQFIPLSPPRISNPYCTIPTFQYDNIPARGYSTIIPVPGGSAPIIYMQGAPFTGNPELLHFALAHECGHQVLGHIVFNHINPFAAFMTVAEEYAADCWAAHAVMQSNDRAAIQAAVADANSFPAPTMPNRVKNIISCAGNIEASSASDFAGGNESSAFCQNLQKTIEAAKGQFAAIKGSLLDGQTFQTKAALPGLTCSLDINGNGQDSYSTCETGDLDDDHLDSNYENLKGRVGTCLGGTWAATPRVSKSGKTFTRFEKNGAPGYVEVHKESVRHKGSIDVWPPV
jgi:hypothetical protein